MTPTREQAIAELERRKTQSSPATPTREQAIAELERRKGAQQPQEAPNPQSIAGQRVEQRQAERSTIGEDLYKSAEPLNFGGKIGSIAQHLPILPGGQSVSSARTLISGAGAVGRTAEALIAEPSLAIQRGDMGDILPSIVRVLTGKAKAEIGDVYYGAGAPEPVAKVAGVATDILFGYGVDRLANSKIGSKMRKAYDSLKDTVGEKGIKLEKEVAKTTQDFVRSVRPTVAKRKASPKEYQKIVKDIKDVANDITNNKETMVFVDDFGEKVAEGRTPETLKEMTQAYETRMTDIFDSYDEIQQQAGDAGAKVDLDPIRKVYKKYADPKKRAFNRDVSNEAIQMRNDLADINSFTPKETQEALKDLNLKIGSAWLNNKPLANYLKEVQDVLVKQLDLAIDEAGKNNREYFALRKKYGAYRNFQQDINKRAWIHGRGAFQQMPDMLNMFSAGDFMKGIAQTATGQPAQGFANIAKASVQNAIAKNIKKWNSPDFRTKKMFSAVEKSKAHLEQFGKTKVFTGEIVDAGPRKLNAPKEVLGLPNLPKGAQRPQFRAGTPRDARIMPNESSSRVIRGISPEEFERQARARTPLQGLPQPQQQKLLPNLPRGAQRPQFRAGGDTRARIMPNEGSGKTIIGEAPKKIKKRKK